MEAREARTQENDIFTMSGGERQLKVRMAGPVLREDSRSGMAETVQDAGIEVSLRQPPLFLASLTCGVSSDEVSQSRGRTEHSASLPSPRAAAGALRPGPRWRGPGRGTGR